MPAQPMIKTSAPSSSRSSAATSAIRAKVRVSSPSSVTPRPCAIAGHAVVQAHLADVAQVARDRLLQDRDHAEALASVSAVRMRTPRCPARLGRHFARGVQARIGVAGDDEAEQSLSRLSPAALIGATTLST